MQAGVAYFTSDGWHLDLRDVIRCWHLDLREAWWPPVEAQILPELKLALQMLLHASAVDPDWDALD